MDKVPALAPGANLIGDENGEVDPPEQEQVVVPDPPAVTISTLPEEVLEKIFAHLDIAKDLHAVSNTKEQFNRILEPTKTVWAFKTVFPNIFSRLDHKDILNCRLVCKNWCQGVDHDLQSRPHTRPDSLYPDETTQQTENGIRPTYAPRIETSLISKGFFMNLTLNRSSEIKNFLEEMGNHPRNPLVLRTVYLENIERAEDYWETALSLLERFGKEIWHINIENLSSCDTDLSEEEDLAVMCRCDMFVRMLGHMPNLRCLNIYGVFVGQVNHPFPALPHLHTLLTLFDEDDWESNRHFVNELLRTCSSQVKLIDCDLTVWKRHRRHFTNMPQIRHVKLIIDARLPDWRQFCTQLVAPNLKKLTLILKEHWTTSDFLRPLSSSFPSLEYLMIRFVRAPCQLRSVGPPQFVLENVKTLEIDDNPDGEVPYNQLFQHMPALEYLLVCHRRRPGNNGSFDDSTQWNLFNWLNGPSIENSDIWAKLPCLKELTLARLGLGDMENEIRAWKTFTRGMYANL